MFRRVWWVVLAVCLAGCAEPADEVSAEAVDWAERVCQSVAGGADKLAEPPRMDPANPAGARDGMVGYLDLLVSALDSVRAGITDAGPAPVTNGAAAVDAAMATIDDTKSAITEAQTALRDAPVTDPAQFQQALGDIGKNMTQLRNVDGPVKDLTANPDLHKAFSRAASCQAL